MFAAVTDRWNRLRHNEQIILNLVAVAVGIVVAYAAIAFRGAIAGIQWIAFGFPDEAVFTKAAQLPDWQILLLPALGGLIVGVLLKLLMPDNRPHGVPEVIEANVLRQGRLGLREGIGAAVISATSLGFGASAGREGPMVHFGATLASWLAQRLHLSAGLSRTILGCGVAAAVAASFNAPIAGVFFALEVVIGHYALSAFAPVVIASVAGTVVSRIHLGTEPAFILPGFEIVTMLEFPAYLLLGVVCAAIAMTFNWSVTFTQKVVESLPIPPLLLPACGGLLVGALAVNFPHILGVGYEATDAALNQQLSLWLLIALIVLKTAATAITLGCRFGGGVFSPALFLGAMTGGAFGIVAAHAFPELATGHGAYAIVGMSAMAAAVLGAPISTILIVFELTGDYEMTIAAMVASSTATVLTQQLQGPSYFHRQLVRRGLNLAGGRARHLLRAVLVRDVMDRRFHIVREDAPLRDLKRLLPSAPATGFLLVDEDEGLTGMLSFADIRAVAFEADVDEQMNAKEIAHAAPAFLTAGDSLERALQAMETSGENHLPVVDDDKTRRVVGIVHQVDALRAYNRALLQLQAEEHGVRS
ncbi:MAG: chloride channel protein [Alphaproteobacteria bacterium]